MLGVVLVGTAWFWWVEHWSLVDSVEQTVTTVTTVGLGEVRPFDNSAKWFAVVLSIVGVTAGLLTLGALFQEQLEDSLARYGRRQMDRRIAKLTQHVVLCGYGRVGTQIARLLDAKESSLVVVDVDERQVNDAIEKGYAVVRGTCTEDDTLRQAGIEDASILIVSLASDADAISTVLSARALNPNLRIVTRANATESEAKLKRAGADRVVNPLSQGAHRMASFAQQPDVADFLDVVVHDEEVEFELSEVTIREGSALAGVGLGDAHIRRRTGALVLALRLEDGSFVSIPGPEVRLQPRTTVIAIGTTEQLRALADLVEVEVETS